MGLESPNSSLHLGWIPYWNLLPLRYELNRLYRDSITWSVGVPTHINALLAQGEVGAAPCSSICLLRYPQLEVALPLGIAARGAVRSVYIGYGRGMEETVEEIRRSISKMAESVRQLRQSHGDDARSVGKALWLARNEWRLPPPCASAGP